jgi:hypothetical protein
MLAAPAAWAGSVLDNAYAGTSFNASAGPAGGGFGGPGGVGAPGASRPAFAERFPGGEGGFGNNGGGGIGASATATLSSAEQKLYDYVSAHRDGASYLFAVTSWNTASPYIIATGQEVLPMGGFSGSVPSPTLAAVKHLVSTGQLKFFLVTGADGAGFGRAGFGGGRDSTVTSIESWVTSSCTEVPAADYAGSGTTGTADGTLYACAKSA